MPRYNNYAYIDGVHLHLTFQSKDLDWEIDYQKLFDLLRYKHGIVVAHYFLGKTPKTQPIHDNLVSYGYNVKLKESSKFNTDKMVCSNCGAIVEESEERYKADVDSFLTMQVISDMDSFNKAVIITSDGDYDELVKRLYRQNKLKLLFAPCKTGCSTLLKKAAKEKIAFMDEYRDGLEKVQESSYRNSDL